MIGRSIPLEEDSWHVLFRQSSNLVLDFILVILDKFYELLSSLFFS